MSLKENEIALERELIGKGKTAPRVTSDHVDACIVGATFSRIPNSLGTLCVMALYNGHVLYGVNTGPVSAENFDPAIGERHAFENAREQIWPLEGYLLRDRLHRAEGGEPVPCYGGVVDDVVAELEAAREALASKGYAYNRIERRWLRGDEDLQIATDAQLLGQPTIVGADYGNEPDVQTAVTAEGEVIEQIDGREDIVREPVAADGYATSEGANVHGIGPHTDGGDNPEYVEAVGPDGKTFSEAVAEVPLATDPEAPHGRHPDGTPVTVVTDEQQATITAADTTEATEGGQVATGPSEPQG